MIQQGVPQRTAHHLVGQLVQAAQQRKLPLRELELKVFQQAHPALDQRVYDVLGAEGPGGVSKLRFDQPAASAAADRALEETIGGCLTVKFANSSGRFDGRNDRWSKWADE